MENGNRSQDIVTEVSRLSVAMIFLVAGVLKVAGSPQMHEMFANYGYPVWLMYLVGVFELLAVVGLIIKSSRPIASGVICVIMFGATGTHLINQEYGMLAFTVAIFLTSFRLTHKFIAESTFEVDERQSPSPEVSPQSEAFIGETPKKAA